jgi:hypothetical protein
MTASPAKAERGAALLSARSAAARTTAAHVRIEAASLRWTTRLAVREAKQRRLSCRLTCVESRRILAAPVSSSWSRLLWERPGPELDQVLVAISARAD